MSDTTNIQILRLAEQQTHLEKRQADALDRIAAELKRYNDATQEMREESIERLEGAFSGFASAIDSYDTVKIDDED